jgi:hypothetical protein
MCHFGWLSKKMLSRALYAGPKISVNIKPVQPVHMDGLNFRSGSKKLSWLQSLTTAYSINEDEFTVGSETHYGALLMANEQQPTCRIRHMDVKKFPLSLIGSNKTF